MRLQGLTVCVNYEDILQLTLPTTIPHFEKLVIVTANFDRRTADVVEIFCQANPAVADRLIVHYTDAFYNRGAVFNKGAAIEEATLQHFDRDCWSVIFDADIVMPRNMLDCLLNLDGGVRFETDDLYAPRRLQVIDPTDWLQYGHDYKNIANYLTAQQCPEIHDANLAGFFQLFHPSSLHLAHRPWYTTNWRHAGGSDSDFTEKFPPDQRHWLAGFRVWHLGPYGANWHGRASPRLDGSELLGPVTAEEARSRQSAMRRLRGRRIINRFDGEKL